MIDPDRLRFFETRDRLRRFLEEDVERQFQDACKALADAVTASLGWS